MPRTFAVWYGYGYMMAYTNLQLNATFLQRMTILTPYLDELEEESFHADWARMTARSDYLSLQADLEAVAEANDVELPPPLLR